MNLHTNKIVFTDTLLIAAGQMNIPIFFVEKDYWITLVLSRLAKSKYAAATVFKGGTSLSKGFGLVPTLLGHTLSNRTE